MELSNLIAFVAVATVLVISPGPNGLLISKTVPISGAKAGLANVWGFVAAFYVHGTLSVLGISMLLVQSAQAFFIFKLLGATYLIWIGVKALFNAYRHQPPIAPSRTTPARQVPLTSAFAEGFLTNVLNPKVSLFYLAAFPQFIGSENPTMQVYLLVSCHALINFFWFTAMICTLVKVTRATNSNRFKRWLNSVTGIVFIGFGAKLALLSKD